jgi:hypothetical protein
VGQQVLNQKKQFKKKKNKQKNKQYHDEQIDYKTKNQ